MLLIAVLLFDEFPANGIFDDGLFFNDSFNLMLIDGMAFSMSEIMAEEYGSI